MAKFKKADYKKQYNLYSIMGLLGDILFYPIILIALLSCVFIYADKQTNKVPSILGTSIVFPKSGSMLASGFKIGDMVLLKSVNPENLRVNDIIGFYFYQDSVDSDLTLKKLQSANYSNSARPNGFTEITEYDTAIFNEYRDNERTNIRKSIKQISQGDNTPKIYFHRIQAIYINEDGSLFYKTLGDSNGLQVDGYNISEEYIIGQYTYTPEWLRSTITFVSSGTGIIALVVIPLCILCLFMLFSIIEQISKMYLEKKVLARLIRYDSEESLDANIGIEMEMPDKVKFYATSPPKEKNGVANFLWGYKRNTGIERDVAEYDQIMQMLPYLETDAKKYWYFFINATKSNRQKRLIEKAWQDWTVDQKLLEKFKKSKKDNNEGKKQE